MPTASSRPRRPTRRSRAGRSAGRRRGRTSRLSAAPPGSPAEPTTSRPSSPSQRSIGGASSLTARSRPTRRRSSRRTPTRGAAPKSRSMTPGSIRQLRPISTPRGTRGALADQGDAGVQALRLVAVRAQVVADTRRGRRRRCAPPCRRSRGRAPRPPRSTASNMTIESRTIAPAATRTPGDRTLCSTRALDDAAVADHRARRPCLRTDARRRPLLALGVDQPAEVVELDARRRR